MYTHTLHKYSLSLSLSKYINHGLHICDAASSFFWPIGFNYRTYSRFSEKWA